MTDLVKDVEAREAALQSNIKALEAREGEVLAIFLKLEELRGVENDILEQKNIVLSKEEAFAKIEDELKDIIGKLAAKSPKAQVDKRQAPRQAPQVQRRPPHQRTGQQQRR
jgi:hypothetical protein